MPRASLAGSPGLARSHGNAGRVIEGLRALDAPVARCGEPTCWAHDGEACALGHMRREDCPKWQAADAMLREWRERTAPAERLCKCGHACWLHVADRGRCTFERSDACMCTRFVAADLGAVAEAEKRGGR